MNGLFLLLGVAIYSIEPTVARVALDILSHRENTVVKTHAGIESLLHDTLQNLLFLSSSVQSELHSVQRALHCTVL